MKSVHAAALVTRVRPHCDLCDGTEAFAELTEYARVVWYTRAKTGVKEIWA